MNPTALLILLAVWLMPQQDAPQPLTINQHLVVLRVTPDLSEEALRDIGQKLKDEEGIELTLHEVKYWPLTKQMRKIDFSVETLMGSKGRYQGGPGNDKREIGFFVAKDQATQQRLGDKFGVGILPEGI